MDEPSGAHSNAATLGFLSSLSGSSVSTGVRCASAVVSTLTTYQPFLLVIRSFDPSRLKDPTENDSLSSLDASSAGLASAGFSSFGLGVSDRGFDSSMPWT